MIQIHKLHKDAQIPSRGSEYSAGLDLHTVETTTLLPGAQAMLPIGIAMAIPQGYVGLIWPRSKLAIQLGIEVLAGVVDSDYRGEVHVALLNTSDNSVTFRPGDRVAQMLVQPVLLTAPHEVASLNATARGTSGITDPNLRL